jgi:hypothetical protein
VWLQQHVALDVGSLRIPVPWYQSIDPLFSIFGVPLLFWIWHQQASRRREPGELAKFGIGAWLAAASNLILVVAILAAGSARVHPIWPFLYCAGQGIAFLYYWPTLLALASQRREGKRDHDGARLHDLGRREQPRRLDRRLLRSDDTRDVLDHARCHRCDRRNAGDAVLAPTRSNVREEPVRPAARALEVE